MTDIVFVSNVHRGLHRVTGRAKKCGPSAMSAITGKPTHEMAALLREVTGRSRINGVRETEIKDALHRLGYRVEFCCYLSRDTKPTVYQFLKDTPRGGGRFIILAGSSPMHYIAFCNGQVADSGYWCSRKPAPWRDALKSGKKARVHSWLRIEGP